MTKHSVWRGPLTERVKPGQRFGSWVVLPGEPFMKSRAVYVPARCDCGVEREANLRFLETGRSTQCRACATRQRHRRAGDLIVENIVDKRLQKRVNAWFQRCENPKDKSYHNYGGRGIRCFFSSVSEGVAYIKEALPHPSYLKLDIDRRDNNGHYERGNLRLVSRSTNAKNKRGACLVTYQGEQIPMLDWKQNPYCPTRAGIYVAQGLSGEDILERAWQSVHEKRKCWRTLRRRLLSMTS